jgi:hypothetical protein
MSIAPREGPALYFFRELELVCSTRSARITLLTRSDRVPLSGAHSGTFLWGSTIVRTGGCTAFQLEARVHLATRTISWLISTNCSTHAKMYGLSGHTSSLAIK